MVLEYQNDSKVYEMQGRDESILLQETKLNEKTVLDYRDFLNQSIERSRSTCIHNESFVNQSGLDDLAYEDLEELGRHCHSDISSDVDGDPFFEYNTCHKQTKLELKDLEKE